MLAVSNTSPVSNLAAIDRPPLLKAQFPVLWIPTAVAQELRAHPNPVTLALIEAAVTDGWLQFAEPQDTPFYRMLCGHVHQGEAAAIALATDLSAGIVVIDEQEGRALAAQSGLSVTGTLGILLRAKRAGSIPVVNPRFRPCG